MMLGKSGCDDIGSLRMKFHRHQQIGIGCLEHRREMVGVDKPGEEIDCGETDGNTP